MEWTPEAEDAVKKVPFFVRKRVKARVEKEAREAGVNDRLVKPVDPRDLKTVLDKYLADRNARGE